MGKSENVETYKNVAEYIKSEEVEINDLGKYDLINDTQKFKTGNGQEFVEITNPYERFFIYKYEKSSNKTKIKEMIDKACNEEIKLPEEWKKEWQEKWKEEWKEEQQEKWLKERQEEWRKKSEIFNGKLDRYQIGDPDLESTLLQMVYKELWPDLAKLDFVFDGAWIGSDAMTSVHDRFKDAMTTIKNNGKEQWIEDGDPDLEQLLKQIWVIYGVLKVECSSQHWWTILFTIVVAATLGEDFYKLIDREYYYIKSFIKKCFTIGNYCAVPKGFNRARSGDGDAIHDYWDLTLQKIYEWYKAESEKRKDECLKKLLHNEGNFDNCKEWLKWFEENGKRKEISGWRNFIDTLFLQDYVIDAEHEDYRPKPFWIGHSWENPKMPEDPIEIDICLQEISRRITARSKRIIEALKNQQIKKEQQ